jgi:mono/diheme cytochrome c family protein
MSEMLRTTLLLSTLTLAAPLSAAPVDFAREVQPIFAKHCYDCHGPEKQKSGFRLDVKQEAFTGGDAHAPNLLAGKGTESPLYRFISGLDTKVQMPPKSKGAALTAAEVATIKQWLDEGAAWPDGIDTAKVEDRMDWWAFQPLVRPSSEAVQDPQARVTQRNPIDAFIQARLRAENAESSPEADARTLIRRLSYDLTGLPPSPEEVETFMREQQSTDAAQREKSYEALADRLLASPRYGERWARHWLDLVHYGETHGYDKDKPRLNAWPFRDYVIRAFNEDRPYARFVEEQIAGDVLYPGTTDGIVALGFIAAGPWDLIGHAEVPESKIDGKIARHLDRDDMVQNAMGAFTSLTVGCAQCHNHKFDPISQEDYYALQAVFSALDRADRKYFADPQLTSRFNALEIQQRDLAAKQKSLDEKLKSLGGESLAKLDERIEAAKARGKGNLRAEYGYHSSISTTQDAVKWVQLDLGQSAVLDRVVLRPCYDDFNGIGAGFGFPLRYRVEASEDVTFKTGVIRLSAHEMKDVTSPGTTPVMIQANGATARYIRVTAARLAPRKDDFILALAEVQVHDTTGRNLAEGTTVTAQDSIEAPPRWRKANLVDASSPAADESDALATLQREREKLLTSLGDAALQRELRQVKADLVETGKALSTFPKPDVVYAGMIYHGSGSFSGTGANHGKPRPIHLLTRGDVKTPAQEVRAGTVTAISARYHLPARFDLTNPDDEGARRAALAKWITDRDNPLTWRSIVNRVWQHHFGRALVDTPNDFGRMGARPTHPELLDWLAVTFRDDMQGSLKQLHKLIVMSHTYRQTSEVQPTHPMMAQDGDNQLLWRQNRRKLDAESVRDSVLAMAGKLDLTMGGPSFQDFIIEKPQHSPHYEYTLHDPNDPKSHRRSIYRFIVRSQQQPFMTTLDCADPSMRVDKRNESISPLQALTLMNNGLTVAMADHFANRVQREAQGLDHQVQRAVALALCRPASQDETEMLTAYAKQHGLANLCRLLMNLNEFNFVD